MRRSLLKFDRAGHPVGELASELPGLANLAIQKLKNAILLDALFRNPFQLYGVQAGFLFCADENLLLSFIKAKCIFHPTFSIAFGNHYESLNKSCGLYGCYLRFCQQHNFRQMVSNRFFSGFFDACTNFLNLSFVNKHRRSYGYVMRGLYAFALTPNQNCLQYKELYTQNLELQWKLQEVYQQSLLLKKREEKALRKQRKTDAQQLFLRDTIDLAGFERILFFVRGRAGAKERRRFALVLLYLTGLRVENQLLFSIAHTKELFEKGNTRIQLIKGGEKRFRLRLSPKSRRLLQRFKENFIKLSSNKKGVTPFFSVAILLKLLLGKSLRRSSIRYWSLLLLSLKSILELTALGPPLLPSY